MAMPGDWKRAYARQARADYRSWQALEADPAVPACHAMLFLQMACEKACKAWLIANATPPEALQAGHGYVANPLPLVIRQQLDFIGRSRGSEAGFLTFVKHLAVEVELLNPSVDRDGRRPDNCEYPWEDDTRSMHSPLDWTFAPVALLRLPHGGQFVTVLGTAIDRLLSG